MLVVLAAGAICPGIGVRSENPAVLRGYLQSMKAKSEKLFTILIYSQHCWKKRRTKKFKSKRVLKDVKDVEESVDKMISNRKEQKAYSEWKSNQDTQPFNENIEKNTRSFGTLSPEQRGSKA